MGGDTDEAEHLSQNGGAGGDGVTGEAFGVPSQSSLISSLDHSDLGRRQASVCAERRGPQPGLEILDGARHVTYGKWRANKTGVSEEYPQPGCIPLTNHVSLLLYPSPAFTHPSKGGRKQKDGN